jgi:hypothetical protein
VPAGFAAFHEGQLGPTRQVRRWREELVLQRGWGYGDTAEPEPR